MRLFHELTALGCEVRIAYPAGTGEPDVVESLGESAVALSVGRARLAKRYPLWQLATFVRSVAPDVVMTTGRMDLTAGLGRALWPRATAWVPRPANDIAANEAGSGRRLRVANTVLRRLLARADAIVCQSEPIRVQLLRWGIADSKLRVIGNGIEAPATTRPAPAAWPPRHFVAVGRLMHQKGFDILLESLAAADLPAGWNLRVFGTGPDADALTATAQRLQLPVEFAGHTRDIAKEYQGADVLLAPSRYEGFSNVVLEALSHGTPVVANKSVAGVSEAVLEGDNGWLSDEPSVAAFSAALQRMTHEPLSLDSERIAADAVTRLSIRQTAQRYRDFLGEAASARRAR